MNSPIISSNTQNLEKQITKKDISCLCLPYDALLIGHLVKFQHIKTLFAFEFLYCLYQFIMLPLHSSSSIRFIFFAGLQSQTSQILSLLIHEIEVLHQQNQLAVWEPCQSVSIWLCNHPWAMSIPTTTKAIDSVPLFLVDIFLVNTKLTICTCVNRVQLL